MEKEIKMTDEVKDFTFVVTVKNVTREKGMKLPAKLMELLPNDLPGTMVSIVLEDDIEILQHMNPGLKGLFWNAKNEQEM
jgi:hypothetical protein